MSNEPCPSCDGLNTSCPDGCGRDPLTGELNGTRLEPIAVDDGLVEALAETLRRYPHAAEALVFLSAASGLNGREPNAEQIAWAEKVIARAVLEQGQ